MRLLKVVGIVVCVLALVSVVAAGTEKQMGIRDTYRVTFDAATRVGTALLPAGDYVIHHTMEGAEHIMVFQSGRNPAVRVKCTLVPLGQKSDSTQKTYKVNAANERVLEELVFKGDTAKHVF